MTTESIRQTADTGFVAPENDFTINGILTRLDGVTKSGSGFLALCPAHDDRNPSLTIMQGNNGRPVLYCHAGCEFDAIITAIGFDRPDTRQPSKQSTKRQIATYDYSDENGVLLYQKVRYDPKGFAIRRPDGDGWTWKKGDARPVLYRLPELLKSKLEGKTLFIPEGEKDADRLHSLGLTATTNIEGASDPGKRPKWRPEYSEQLAGAHRVVILPDNDAPGRAHAAAIAQALTGRVADIRILELSGLPEKGDVSDWMDTGHTADELMALVEQTPPYTGPPEREQPLIEAYGDDPPAIKPTIDALPGQLHLVVNKAERALIAADVPIFQRGGQLVRPARIPAEVQIAGANLPAGSLIIEPVTKPWLAETMNQVAVWRKHNERERGMVKADCPLKYAEHYLARKGDWKIRVLTGIIEAPTLRRDGSLLTQPGYDALSGLYLNYTGQPVTLPDNPTREDALNALDVLLEPLSEFPFVSDLDRSVALSGILTAVIRRTLRTAPYHAADAPTAGAGKGLLVDVAALIATGRPATAINQGADPAEDEKRVGALLIKGVSVISLDNVERYFEGEFLCSLATQASVDHRILGKSETVAIPTNTTSVFITGNNLTFKGDITRRVLICRIDPRCERPDALQFKRNLHEFIPAHRHNLLIAALTILRAYIYAGSPPHGKAPYGSFEEWDKRVRGALLWLDQPDPLDSRERITGNDPAATNLRALLESWFKAFDSRQVTAHEVIAAATPRTGDGNFTNPQGEELRRVLLEVAGQGEGINSRIFGRYLSKNRDKVAGGYRLEQAGDRQRALLWKVKPTGGSELSELSEFCEFLQPKAGKFASDDIREKGGNAKKVVVAETNSHNSHNSPVTHLDDPPALVDDTPTPVPPDCRSCRSYAPLARTCGFYGRPVAMPAAPICNGHQFKPREKVQS